jgi:hypothetical protein
MKFILHITVSLLFYSCFAQEKDYSELKFIYSDLVDVFKSENDQKLKDFCYKLAIDGITLDYMKNNSLCYRGIPCKMNEENIEITDIVDKFYPSLVRVRNTLKHNGHLDNLTHADSTEYKWDIEIFINEKVDGYDKPVKQNHYSTSIERYTEAISKADSLGKSIDQILLNGKKGDVIIIKGTEMAMILKSGTKTIKYQIGEMVFINNKWSLFTKPNDDYYIIEE